MFAQQGYGFLQFRRKLGESLLMRKWKIAVRQFHMLRECGCDWRRLLPAELELLSYFGVKTASFNRRSIPERMEGCRAKFVNFSSDGTLVREPAAESCSK